MFKTLPTIDVSVAFEIVRKLASSGFTFERMEVKLDSHNTVVLDNGLRVTNSDAIVTSEQLDIQPIIDLGHPSTMDVSFTNANVRIDLVGGTIDLRGISFTQFAATGIELTDEIRRVTFR